MWKVRTERILNVLTRFARERKVAMFKCLANTRGISLIEALIANFLIVIGVLALISVQPSGWRLSATSDLLGRAAGILQAELEATRF